MSGVEALARLLFEWNTPTDPYFVIKGRAGDVDERDPYIPIVEALLAHPGPLLAALHEAGVLTEEYGIPDGLAGLRKRTFGSYRMADALADGRRVERRYVTEWRPDARP